MKHKIFLLAICCFLVYRIIPEGYCEPHEELIRGEIAEEKTTPIIRALSLKVLQKRIQDCKETGTFPPEILHLAGINSIKGYVIDKTNQDIILIGRVNLGDPPLYLDDFVVALRNAWLKYATLKGNTYYYSNPGCSIDPDPKIIQKLQTIGERLNNKTSLEAISSDITEWHWVGQSPQDVRVLGIPFDTRFAWVMVKADYDMKKIVDGSDILKITGFSSLIDMHLEQARSDILKGRSLSVPVSSMNRFWFYPGENSYLEDEGIIVIDKCPVVLLTEREYLSKKGEVVGSGESEKFAQEFADNFTKKYAQIAQERAIYTELENLFRFVAVAKILDFKAAEKESGLSLEYLLDQYPISKIPVNRSLSGRTNIKEFRNRRNVPGGYEIAQLMIPSCGGVNIGITVTQTLFYRDSREESRNIKNLKKKILECRPSPFVLSWQLPLGWIVKLEKRNAISNGYVYAWPNH